MTETTSPWRGAVPIETPRLVLRELRRGDAPRIARYVGDIGVARMLAVVPLPYNEKDAETFVAAMGAINADGRGLGLAVAEKGAPDLLIGVMSFIGALPVVEIGWWLGRPYWGRGFATEAARALIAVAFREPRLDRIVAGAFFDNPASLHVQDKLGFARTGESQRHSLARRAFVRHIDTEIVRPASA
ncbi:GNAT family N-acetyltransferase [Phreatobacter sp. AB_2022a]|uniref:GNAT family N-acetyltransferase n=1 Tax=Phreatobacter sp. AB_2022a TaxID=3003134 RepID=UPI00228748BC|nr:GNAT family N-acetyltransferase [Phreatobacter sp. AB_2022a]MCZ0735685.1 GNAT family N-acetyltransferase [Phreatobacter sp. AB_2022a]